MSIDALCAVLIGSIAYEDASVNAMKSSGVNVTLNGIPNTSNGLSVSGTIGDGVDGGFVHSNIRGE